MGRSNNAVFGGHWGKLIISLLGLKRGWPETLFGNAKPGERVNGVYAPSPKNAGPAQWSWCLCSGTWLPTPGEATQNMQRELPHTSQASLLLLSWWDRESDPFQWAFWYLRAWEQVFAMFSHSPVLSDSLLQFSQLCYQALTRFWTGEVSELLWPSEYDACIRQSACISEGTRHGPGAELQGHSSLFLVIFFWIFL